MKHLIKVRAYYYYNRRVPEHVRELDKRSNVRISLNTDSRREAIQRVTVLNEQIEAYWKELLKKQAPHNNDQFSKTVKIARQMGFTYQPMPVVTNLPILDLVERILTLKDASLPQVDAALGGKPLPAITVKKALEKYWDFSKDKTLNKSVDQVRKWRNPRIRAAKNFVKAVGNKNLSDISREDILAYKDWWLKRIAKENMNPETANKEFVQIKVILESVSDNMQLNMDISNLFKKIKIKARHKQTRQPFTDEQIKAILNSPKLELLKPDEKWFIHALAATGARPSEIVGLLPCDIRINTPVPYISIKDRKERELKTPHSERDIPLIDSALEAFTQMPQGFPRHRHKPDNLTNILNKFLRKHDLLPSLQHTLYSFRHSFQDRLLAANAPDRVQAELMGHKFNRPKYGNGPSLEQKMDWMERIKI